MTLTYFISDNHHIISCHYISSRAEIFAGFNDSHFEFRVNQESGGFVGVIIGFLIFSRHKKKPNTIIGKIPSIVKTSMNNADNVSKTLQKTIKVNTTKISYSRSKLDDKMEKSLTIWMENMSQKRKSLIQAKIANKGKCIFDESKKKEVRIDPFFNVSKERFARYKSRTEVRRVKITCETTGADIKDDKYNLLSFKILYRMMIIMIILF